MQGKKKLFNADLLILAIIAIACIYMFCAAIPMSAEGKLFPQVISGLTFIVTIVTMGKQVMAAKAAEAVASGEAEENAEPKRWNHLILVLISIAYEVLLTPIGFIPCTIALFILIPIVLGNRKFKVVIPVAVIATIIFYLVFKKGFYVSLPSGIFPFL